MFVATVNYNNSSRNNNKNHLIAIFHGEPSNLVPERLFTEAMDDGGDEDHRGWDVQIVTTNQLFTGRMSFVSPNKSVHLREKVSLLPDLLPQAHLGVFQPWLIH